jgi:hypothetical protein
MKANNTDRNETGTASRRSVETSARNTEEIRDDEEITIRIENIEDVIAATLSASRHERGSE